MTALLMVEHLFPFLYLSSEVMSEGCNDRVLEELKSAIVVVVSQVPI